MLEWLFLLNLIYKFKEAPGLRTKIIFEQFAPAG